MRCSVGTLAGGVQANNRPRYAMHQYRHSISPLGTMFDDWDLPRWRETRLLGKLQLCHVHQFRSAVRPVLLGCGYVASRWPRVAGITREFGFTHLPGGGGVKAPSCTMGSRWVFDGLTMGFRWAHVVCSVTPALCAPLSTAHCRSLPRSTTRCPPLFSTLCHSLPLSLPFSGTLSGALCHSPPHPSSIIHHPSPVTHHSSAPRPSPPLPILEAWKVTTLVYPVVSG